MSKKNDIKNLMPAQHLSTCISLELFEPIICTIIIYITGGINKRLLLNVIQS